MPIFGLYCGDAREGSHAAPSLTDEPTSRADPEGEVSSVHDDLTNCPSPVASPPRTDGEELEYTCDMEALQEEAVHDMLREEPIEFEGNRGPPKETTEKRRCHVPDKGGGLSAGMLSHGLLRKQAAASLERRP